jgi:hypothetical protein
VPLTSSSPQVTHSAFSMSGHQNGHWHTANGGGLPFRPPTMDEALPYSPFTSILPFSPGTLLSHLSVRPLCLSPHRRPLLTSLRHYSFSLRRTAFPSHHPYARAASRWEESCEYPGRRDQRLTEHASAPTADLFGAENLAESERAIALVRLRTLFV